MRYLCDVCERLVPPAAFRVELGVLVMTCARCGQESRARPEEALVAAVAQTQAEAAQATPARGGSTPSLKVVTLRPSEEQVREAAELARSGDPFAVPEGFCPKCVAVRKEGVMACASCGLVYANFDPGEHQVSKPLQEAWLAVLERWDDRDAHDRLISLAVGRGELAMAGRLYRIRLAQAPEDLYAQRGRDEVVRLATASPVSFAKSPTQGPSPRAQLWAVVFFILILAVVGALIYRQFRMSFGGP